MIGTLPRHTLGESVGHTAERQWELREEEYLGVGWISVALDRYTERTLRGRLSECLSGGLIKSMYVFIGNKNQDTLINNFMNMSEYYMNIS